MFGWIKRMFRFARYVELNKVDPPDPYLEHGGDRYRIVGARGLMLIGEGSAGVRLLGVGNVSDQDHFWKLWKHFNPDAGLRWEDGLTFVPPK